MPSLGVEGKWLWAPEWGEPSAWDKGLRPPRRGPLSRLTRGGLASLFRALRGEGEQRALGSDGRAHRGSEGLSNFSGVSSIAGLGTRPGSECRQALGVELGSLNSGLSLSACCVAPGTLPNLSGPCLLTHMSMPCGLGRWRLWVGKVLFLCFHVGLSLKEQFWAEITVTCTPPLGRSGPYVLDSWTTLRGALYWECRKREDLGLQFCSRVVCGGSWSPQPPVPRLATVAPAIVQHPRWPISSCHSQSPPCPIRPCSSRIPWLPPTSSSRPASSATPKQVMSHLRTPPLCPEVPGTPWA